MTIGCVGGGAGGLVSSRVEYFETTPQQEIKKSHRKCSKNSPRSSDKRKSQSNQQAQQGAASAPPLIDDSRVDNDAEDVLRHEGVREVVMMNSGNSSKPEDNRQSQDNAGNDTDATPHRRGGATTGGQSSTSSISSKKKKKKKSKLPPSAASSSAPVSAAVSPQAQTPKAVVPGSELTEKGLEHYQKGEFAHAQKAFSTVLKTQSLSVGCEDISVATTLGNLGAVFLKQERLLEAERALAESLAMKRRLAEAVPVVLADTLNNLGNCANLRGDYDESLKYYHQALSELRDNNNTVSNNNRGSGGGGRQPPARAAQVANLLFNIGRLEIQRREWDHALDALSEAWRMTRDVWGNSHIYVAQTLDLLGFVQISTKEYDSAIISFTGALSIYRRINGPLHPDVASALFNVGMVREARGDLDDALEAYKTARDLHIRLGTREEDPGFTTVRHSIASMQKSVTQKKLAHLVAKHQGTLLKKKQASGLI